MKPGHALALLVLLVLAPACSIVRSQEGWVEKLRTGDAEERSDALIALAERAAEDVDLQNDLCERALRIVDEDESLPVRLVALRTLSKLGVLGVRPKDVAASLGRHARADKRRERGADDRAVPDFWCRIEALQGLATMVEGPTNRVVDEAVRVEALESLRVGIQQELESDRDVRIHAARELAILRPESPPILTRLVAALSDETPDVRAHAYRALVAIAGGDHGPTKADWERWAEREYGATRAAPTPESR